MVWTKARIVSVTGSLRTFLAERHAGYTKVEVVLVRRKGEEVPSGESAVDIVQLLVNGLGKTCDTSLVCVGDESSWVELKQAVSIVCPDVCPVISYVDANEVLEELQSVDVRAEEVYVSGEVYARPYRGRVYPVAFHY